jgi:hypothetical protein
MLEDLQPPRNGTLNCKVADMVNSLEPADKEILQAAVLNTQLWGSNTLSNALKIRGLSIAGVTITRHRKRLCTCYRD